MRCEVEVTDEFGEWWDSLSIEEQESVAYSVRLLEEKGIALGHPHTSNIVGSKHTHMRELRIQHAGQPYRVLYAFDPRRMAILLIGAGKTGQDRWYEIYIPIADNLYDQHLVSLKKEGFIK